jgi:hypothetical protein
MILIGRIKCGAGSPKERLVTLPPLEAQVGLCPQERSIGAGMRPFDREQDLNNEGRSAFIYELFRVA